MRGSVSRAKRFNHKGTGTLSDRSLTEQVPVPLAGCINARARTNRRAATTDGTTGTQSAPIPSHSADRHPRCRKCSTGNDSRGRRTSDRASAVPSRSAGSGCAGRSGEGTVFPARGCGAGARRTGRRARAELRSRCFQYRVIRRPDHVFCFGHGGCVNRPPSTQSVWPVTNALSSVARNRTARATSAGSPIRPSGVTAPHVPA